MSDFLGFLRCFFLDFIPDRLDSSGETELLYPDRNPFGEGNLSESDSRKCRVFMSDCSPLEVLGALIKRCALVQQDFRSDIRFLHIALGGLWKMRIWQEDCQVSSCLRILEFRLVSIVRSGGIVKDLGV